MHSYYTGMHSREAYGTGTGLCTSIAYILGIHLQFVTKSTKLLKLENLSNPHATHEKNQ